MATAVSTLASAAGARALAHALPRALLSTRWSCSKMGVNALQLRRSVRIQSPKTRKSLIIRAARTESQGVSLGFRAPHFELPEPLTGKVWKLEDFEAYPALLVIFICNHCPFVKHLKKDFVKLANYYMEKGLAVVAISSNSVATHPQDGPEFMAEEAKLFNYPFPYLYDELITNQPREECVEPCLQKKIMNQSEKFQWHLFLILAMLSIFLINFDFVWEM
ncbi:uncharacterized protein LOC116124303 isoform X2 [Pistacia vera]|uniref:uncharacterized protein LOC116124303 isoform X2 n=1 Tax=Pistacia vera TaxID=55513 RepID=UPI001262D496|nr:uncharacterized protein LOC116124303 isoform X2 [Pistacia vera]